jgi:putative oxidoreductase
VRVLDKLQPLALLVPRVALGVIFIAHSYHYVFGGMAGPKHMVEGFGFAWWAAYVSKYTEFFGGILVIFGLLTRLWGIGLVIDMAVAIDKVHWKSGLLGENNYQLPLALASIAFALICFGAGPLSLDAMWRGKRRTPAVKKG